MNNICKGYFLYKKLTGGKERRTFKDGMKICCFEFTINFMESNKIIVGDLLKFE
jgi:hypothetical protein